SLFFFSFCESAASVLSTLSLHDALPIFGIDVVLGRRTGLRAAILREILHLLSFGYGRIVQLRLFFYRKRIFREHALGCLVISIGDRKSTRLNSSHVEISYAVFCLKKKTK